MPAPREHQHRATQNLAFAQGFDLNTTPYLDWVVAGYFYAALHLVDALLAKQENLHPDNHEIRRIYVREKWYLKAIRDEYRTLKDKSEDARYRLITFTRPKIEREIIPLYRAIEAHILPQLAEDTRPEH